MTSEQNLLSAIGHLAGVVLDLERTRPRGLDPMRAEANRAMSASMKLASRMGLRHTVFDGEIFEGRPVLSARYMGGGIARVYDPFDLIYRWHELPEARDLSKFVPVYAERPSPASPLCRGYFLRVEPGHHTKTHADFCESVSI